MCGHRAYTKIEYILKAARLQSIFVLDEDYQKMPPVVSLDRYSPCLQLPNGRYCSGHVTFVSDHPTPLLSMMQEYSAHTATHFNHTRAFIGICASKKCKGIMGNETEDLHRALEACLNKSVTETYNLKVKVGNDFTCIKHNENPYKFDTSDYLVASVVIALVILNVVGSLYDIYWPKKLHTRGEKILLCFSISKNWGTLTAPPSADGEMFKVLFGLRALLSTLVVVVHSMLPVFIACADAKFYENNYNDPSTHILLNGTISMQTFMFVTTFLLVYFLQVYAEKKAVRWSDVPKYIISRWLRLTPSYAVVLGVTATLMRFASSGPFWSEIVVKESMDCRRDWWLHLLYLNNYVDGSKCMPHSWYLATDSQLYILGLTLYMLGRTPRVRNLILPAVFLTGMLLPALHTYFQDLDGTLVVSPTVVQDMFNEDKNFNWLYKRGHTNLCASVIGISCGYLAYYLRKNGFHMKKFRKWRAVYWSIMPVMLALMISCKAFYEEGPRVPMLYRVLIAALMKPIYSLLVAALILGAIFQIEDDMRGFLEWRGWVVPGKLSYSVYLVHIPIIRAACGIIDEAIPGSYWIMFQTSQCIVVTTFLVATVFWIMVEAPLVQLVRHIWTPSSGKKPAPVEEVKEN